MKKKYISIIIIICLITALFSACSNGQKTITKKGFYFDTIISITLYGTEDESYIDGCFKLADKCEKLFSNTLADSDISKINSAAGKESVEVSPETLELIKKGIAYGELSDGAFDITIGSLSDLWNISEISKNLQNDKNEAGASQIPCQKDIDKAVSHIDYSRIKITDKSVMLTDSLAKIDLGGIAKGYIADLMKEYLEGEGIESGIINLGGNILTIGSKENKTPYKVGIQKPFDETGSYIAIVPVTDKSIVTSGVYERYFRVDNKIYHHILDSKTGYPIDNDIYSVTIISDKSIDGDALSTTCFSLGKEKGMRLIESLENVEAVFIYSDMSIHPSSGIENQITLNE